MPRREHIFKRKDRKKAAFAPLAMAWLAEMQLSVKESTYSRYHRIISRYLIPQMEGMHLEKITCRDIQQLKLRLLREGGRDKRPLSPKTVTDMLCILKAIFRYGRGNGYVCPDIRDLKFPPKICKEKRILSRENRITLERNLLDSEDLVSLGILFTLYTGVRIGELCGLQWKDVDFFAGTVHITKTVERIADTSPGALRKTKVIVSEPKTAGSVRVIPLPAFLLQYLQKRRQGKEIYLITGTARYTEPHQFYVKYQRYLAQIGLKGYSFHALRHTFATDCVEHGFDSKSLSEILGHASVTTTLSVYVHPTMRQKKLQMERLLPAAFAPPEVPAAYERNPC